MAARRKARGTIVADNDLRENPRGRVEAAFLVTFNNGKFHVICVYAVARVHE